MYEVQLKSLQLHDRWKFGATTRTVNKSMPKRKILRRIKTAISRSPLKAVLNAENRTLQPSCPQ